MKEQFFSIVFVIFILTIYCKVSNGDTTHDIIHNDIRRANMKIRTTKNELSTEIKEAKNDLSTEIKEAKNDLSTKIDEVKIQLSEQHENSIKKINEEIEELKKKDKEKQDEIDLLKIENEELKLRTAPKSCTELANQKVNRDQDVFIDVDGIDYGFQPTKAHCRFPTNEITFGTDQQIDFDLSEDTKNLTYDEAMLNQIKMTINNSASCSQTWNFSCHLSPLSGNSVSLQCFSYHYTPHCCR